MSQRSPDGFAGAGDQERGAMLPSVALVLVIAFAGWAAVAVVLGVGQGGVAAAGGVEPGVRGLVIWALLWAAMSIALAAALGGSLFAGARAWVALYPLFQRSTAAAPDLHRPLPDGRTEARHAAVAEAEQLLRRRRR